MKANFSVSESILNERKRAQFFQQTKILYNFTDSNLIISPILYMNHSSKDINKLLKIYANGHATPEQRHIVRNAIMDDTSLFVDLLMAMREKAMIEIGLDPKDDFLPAHLKSCAPEAFKECKTFAYYDDDLSMSAPGVSASPAAFLEEKDIFAYLCDELLDK